MPMTLTIIVFSVVAQQLLGRMNARTIGMIGMVLAAIGLLVLRTIEADGSYWTQMLPGILIIAAGLGMTFVPLTLIATGGVDDDDAGLASGLFNTSQQVGGALGLAILATVANTYTADRLASLGGSPDPAAQAVALVDGYHRGFLVGAAMMVVGAVLLGLLVRKRDLDAVTAEQPASVHI